MEPTFLMSLKIWWSMTWRSYLGYLAIAIGFWIVIALVALIIHSIGGVTLKISSFLGCFLLSAAAVIAIYVTLVIYRWVLNSLPFVAYQEAKVDLMKDSVPVEYYGFLDTVCVMWSIFWRGIVLQFIFSVALYLLKFLGLMSVTFIMPEFSIDNFFTIFGAFIYSTSGLMILLIMIFLPIFTIMWTLAQKRTGRWLRLTPR